ncbi:hypothetical protein QQX98_000186 [Neonectria punicea]|uniref:Uncharacterized protein n=1 Tax=Neonectria punicea TaxID=979145 RepID=A0ABR1HVK0_9HYPO
MVTVPQPTRWRHSPSSSSRRSCAPRHHNKQRQSPRTAGGDGGTRDGGRRALEDAGPAHRPSTRARSGPQQMGGYTGQEYYRTTNPGGQGVGLGIWQSQGNPVAQQYSSHPAMAHAPQPEPGHHLSPLAEPYEPPPRVVSPLTESENAFPTWPANVSDLAS